VHHPFGGDGIGRQRLLQLQLQLRMSRRNYGGVDRSESAKVANGELPMCKEGCFRWRSRPEEC